jgi:hypothetical protein
LTADSCFFGAEVITDFNDYGRKVSRVNAVAQRRDQQAGGRQKVGSVMAQATLAAMPNVLSASRTRRRTPALDGLFAELQKVLKGLFDPYRPELHYMRGPGPKWHEKHGHKQPPAL